MTKKAAFADLLLEWDQLLDAANDNGEAMALAASLRAEFAQTVERARELKARQDSLSASRQEATQRLAETVETAVDQARRLQQMAKALLGPSNERLVQFLVAPLRGRRRIPARPVS
ncbi:MAG TPA: hypothetical protein VGS22_22440 [Thermoanaerobaculia bacterium]|jgi:hypothetical protein|nr:hypothetical protein [Thermoanaerobaculia bacterium]